MEKQTWTSVFAAVSVADWKSASANRSTCGSTALSVAGVAADVSIKSSIKFGPNRSTSFSLAVALPTKKTNSNENHT